MSERETEERQEMERVFVVYRNSDLTEGRGPMVLVKAFSNEDTAWRYADTLDGIMGTRPHSGSWRTQPSNGHVTVQPLDISDGSDVRELLDVGHPSKLREKALAKLTIEERRALGVQP